MTARITTSDITANTPATETPPAVVTGIAPRVGHAFVTLVSMVTTAQLNAAIMGNVWQAHANAMAAISEDSATLNVTDMAPVTHIR